MSQQAEASSVRIMRADGAIVGTAFLLSEESILTCAHVVAAALGIAASAPAKPEAQVSLDFPLVAPGQTLTAHVIFWDPIQPNGERLDKVVSTRWKQLVIAVSPVEMPPESILVPSQPHRHRQAFDEQRYQQVRELAQAGLPARIIAKRLAVSERTIQRWWAQSVALTPGFANRATTRSIGQAVSAAAVGGR
jgi:hypothetical protein